MENKKYLACFINSPDNNLNPLLVGNPLLINKMCENFEKMYIINFQNLTFFSDKQKNPKYKLDKNLKLPRNLEFFNPANSRDFANFMIGKELVAIHFLARGFPELKAHLLFAQHEIKFVQITNLGNIQGVYKPLKNFFFRGLLEKIKHDYFHKLTVLLSNLGLVPKIEIRFVTDSRMIEYKKKDKGLFKKIFNYFNFHFAKELILINSRSFDEVKEQKIEISEDQIVFLDAPFNNPQYTTFRGSLDEKTLEKHYYYIKKLITHLSSVYNKKVVVCIHPSENLEIVKNFFLGFEVVQHKTRENIFKAFIVLFHDSSAIIDAILLKKKIITLSSNFMDQNQLDGVNEYVKKVGILKIKIEDDINIDKEDFLLKLEKAKEGYSKYIKSNIAPDGNNIGYEKIIKTLKERFF